MTNETIGTVTRPEVTDELLAQEQWVKHWNELVYSGAADGKGTQAQFMALPARSGRS